MRADDRMALLCSKTEITHGNNIGMPRTEGEGGARHIFVDALVFRIVHKTPACVELRNKMVVSADLARTTSCDVWRQEMKGLLNHDCTTQHS
jgi:hypothetical protein